MEAITICFLAVRGDVSQLRRCTSEGNKHSFGSPRQMLREFTVEQLIHLVDKLKLQMDAIFSGDLATSRNNKGYQKSFSDFVKSLMSAASKNAIIWTSRC